MKTKIMSFLLIFFSLSAFSQSDGVTEYNQHHQEFLKKREIILKEYREKLRLETIIEDKRIEEGIRFRQEVLKYRKEHNLPEPENPAGGIMTREAMTVLSNGKMPKTPPLGQQ